MIQPGGRWKRELAALTQLAIPVVLSELGWMAQSVVDTIMVGRLGPAAIGAVAVGNAVFYTPSLFGIGILLGLDTVVAQAYGRKDYDDCHRWLAQGIYIALAVTPVLMILIAGASFAYARVGITPEVATPAAAYLRMLDWSLLPLLIYGAARRYLQGVGQVRVITVTYIMANLLNWGGNWALIYGHLGFSAMGVRGSALSTVIARVGMAVSLMAFAWRYERRRGHPLFKHWAGPQFDRIKQLVRLGLPAAGQIILEVGAWNVATLSAGLAVARGTGDAQIAINYASVTYMVPPRNLFGSGGSGRPCCRRREIKARARRAGWLALALGSSFMVLAGIAFLRCS